MSRMFVIGTRGSALALRQVALVRAALEAARPGMPISVREIRTEGDASRAPLSQIGGLGVFTKAIEDALLDGSADIAVHSLKDLPTELAPGLALAAVPAREDARDALITRDGRALGALPAGARIGTGSGRRAVLLRALRADVEPAEIRGNVETRVRKVDDGEFDGVVLAMAGLRRMGLGGRVAQAFSIDEMVPAVGQAALGVEVRADDAEAMALVRAIENAATRAAVEAERAFLRRLGGGCRLPVGAHATAGGGALRLRGMIAGGAGAPIFHDALDGDIGAPAALGAALAERMLAAGAQAFVAAAGGSA